uniref:Uncharacterized protein n=1 Tax=Romanomermis culicivorax TaxID=13658 RepID=A0A915I109_ROMCU
CDSWTWAYTLVFVEPDIFVQLKNDELFVSCHISDDKNEINLDHASTLKYRTTGVPPEDIYHSTLPPMDKPTIAKGTAKKSNYLETIIKNAKMVVNMTNMSSEGAVVPTPASATGQYRKFGADRVTMDISSNHAVDSRSTSLSTEARDHSIYFAKVLAVCPTDGQLGFFMVGDLPIIPGAVVQVHDQRFHALQRPAPLLIVQIGPKNVQQGFDGCTGFAVFDHGVDQIDDHAAVFVPSFRIALRRNGELRNYEKFC